MTSEEIAIARRERTIQLRCRQAGITYDLIPVTEEDFRLRYEEGNKEILVAEIEKCHGGVLRAKPADIKNVDKSTTILFGNLCGDQVAVKVFEYSPDKNYSKSELDSYNKKRMWSFLFEARCMKNLSLSGLSPFVFGTYYSEHSKEYIYVTERFPFSVYQLCNKQKAKKCFNIDCVDVGDRITRILSNIAMMGILFIDLTTLNFVCEDNYKDMRIIDMESDMCIMLMEDNPFTLWVKSLSDKQMSVFGSDGIFNILRRAAYITMIVIARVLFERQTGVNVLHHVIAGGSNEFKGGVNLIITSFLNIEDETQLAIFEQEYEDKDGDRIESWKRLCPFILWHYCSRDMDIVKGYTTKILEECKQ